MKATPPTLEAIVNVLYYLETDSGYPFGRKVFSIFNLASIMKFLIVLAS